MKSDIVAATAIAGERDALRRAGAAALPRPAPRRSGLACRPRSASCRCRPAKKASCAVGRDVDIHPCLRPCGFEPAGYSPAQLATSHFSSSGSAAAGLAVAGAASTTMPLPSAGPSSADASTSCSSTGLGLGCGSWACAGWLAKKRGNGGDTGLHGVLRYGNRWSAHAARSTRCTATRRSGRSSPAASAVSTSN